jgi:hypothetical protein
MNPRNIQVEDAALVIFILAVVGVVGASQADIDFQQYLGNSDGGYTPPEYCQEWATAAQENLTGQYRDVSCECKNGEQYQDRIQTPDKVKEKAELTIIKCSVNDQDLLFPVWRVNNSKVLGNNQSAGVIR